MDGPETAVSIHLENPSNRISSIKNKIKGLASGVWDVVNRVQTKGFCLGVSVYPTPPSVPQHPGDCHGQAQILTSWQGFCFFFVFACSAKESSRLFDVVTVVSQRFVSEFLGARRCAHQHRRPTRHGLAVSSKAT